MYGWPSKATKWAKQLTLRCDRPILPVIILTKSINKKPDMCNHSRLPDAECQLDIVEQLDIVAATATLIILIVVVAVTALILIATVIEMLEYEGMRRQETKKGKTEGRKGKDWMDIWDYG